MQLINENIEQKLIDNIKKTQTYDPTINVTDQLQKSALKSLIQKKQLQKQIACQVQGVTRTAKPFTPQSSGMRSDVLKSKVYSTPLYQTQLSTKPSLTQKRIIEDLTVHDLEQDYEDGCDDNSCLFYDDETEMTRQVNCIQRPISRKKPGIGVKRISSSSTYKINNDCTPLGSQPSIRPYVTPINIQPKQTSQSVITYKPYSRLYEQYQVK